MDKPRNIFEQILSGVLVVNGNVVDLSQEIATLREDVDYIKTALLPASNPADREDKPSRPTSKK